jgi:hypothetical protein
MEPFLRSQQYAQLVKEFPAFYETQRFITVFKEPLTNPFPELDESNPHPPIQFP